MDIVVFIAVLGASMMGAQVFGVSLNKLCLIPLEIYLIINGGKNWKFRVNNTQKKLLIWYLISAAGSFSGVIFALLYNNRIIDATINNAKFNIISCMLIFIPIALLLWNSHNKEGYLVSFKKAFVWTARIQVLWGIAQFVLFYTMRFDLNSVVLGGLYESGVTSYSNFTRGSAGILLRVSGLGYVPMFFGLCLVVGFALDSNFLFKMLYVFGTIISLSRSAVVAIMAMVVYSYIETGHWRKIKARSLLKNSLIILAVFILFWVVYRNSVNVQNQVMRLFERFGELSTGDDQGTGRHALYFFATLRLELLDIPIIQKLFGVGNQCGGILLTYYSGSIDWVGLLPSMKDLTHIWTVESDLASIFLESGILGAFFYYGFYYSAFSKSKGNIKKRSLIFGLFCFGVMCNIAGLAFIQLLYISIFSFSYPSNTAIETGA